MSDDDFIESDGDIVSREELLTNQLLEEAIKIIMHEWGYTRERTIQWLNRRVEGED